MDAELQEAIDGLYRAFEGYPLRSSTEPCLHCHEPEVEVVLHEHPLRELSPENLSGFAQEALQIWGEEVDYKHFLPRIMEIAVVEGGFEWPDIETVFGRLSYAKWSQWPEDERMAIERCIQEYWRVGLAHYPAIDDIGSMLTAIAVTGADLRPLLGCWLQQPGLAPVRHLAEFVLTHAALLWTKNRLSHAVSGVSQRTATVAIRDWLRTGSPRVRLTEAFFDESNVPFEEELSDAVRVLEALEAMPQAV